MYENVRELVFFLRVSEEASFSAAARSLDLDPSTISKVVQRLENRLNVRLFHRTSRVLRLTQEGEQLLQAAQKVIQALEEAEEALSPALAGPSGVLRVGSTPAFARHCLAPLMPSFIARYPALKVEFVLGGAAPDIVEQQIDIAFQSGSIPDSTLVARRIGSARWRICASPGYLSQQGTPQAPEDLERHRCLNFLPGSYRSQWKFQGDAAAPQRGPAGAAVAANNGDMLCALAVAGMGLARLADYHIADALAAGRLVTVLDEFQANSEPIYAVYPSRRHLGARVRAFLEHVEAPLAA
ncbi:LysR substrate-binding domain-containing protein [Aquincola sp. MAHUQ-54]|uniref:LysR substrate-binding domain-containing protein n=1 Tax=Aquincola agrisoli TaxID=3119538 RepID=A0AAW9Q6Q5_9BURK